MCSDQKDGNVATRGGDWRAGNIATRYKESQSLLCIL